MNPSLYTPLRYTESHCFELHSLFKTLTIVLFALVATAHANASTTFILNPLEDAYVRDGAHANTTHGTTDSDELIVKIAATDFNRRGYLRYDLRGVNGTVTDAKFRLKVRAINPGVKNNIRPVTDNTWDEDTLTWNNKPGFGNSLGTKTIPAAGQWIEWDVTSHINSEVANGAYYASFAILPSTQTYNLLARYHSSEASNSADRPELIITFNPTDTPPYDVSTFQSVLDTSKLQAPESSPAAVNYGAFDGFADSFFKLTSGQYMQFAMSGYAQRCELRQQNEWVAETSTTRSMVGELKIPSLSSPLEQFTFMQVHSSSSTNGPLLRLNWRDERSGLTDHIWATLRTNFIPKTATVIDLGPRPAGFFKAEIRVQDSKLTVLIDDVVKINNYDISYWDGFSNYFKAGAYINSEGSASVEFKSLDYF
ncbi:DUF7594 domain-containing protein [Rubellicoccus peritrichatus]|uniref:DNRLRE domain-containing protein n=1 Tax=Rubellicoccus peritrichatus TaxID=3080537 RepID=A0AAQ3QVK2_9BACT|nr:DNRLRE domain-containing protein [Puniceicoccus sp. CR14]WOO41703.1 DNRLRE domain-containing protein [Puniceicoccus sp. CR14]